MDTRVSTSEQGLFHKEKLNCLELSPREMQICRLLAWGYIKKEIADKLHISPETVSVHLRNVYRELGIHKETDLTRWYLFKEYCINDNPFKKVLAIFFLVLSISMVLNEENMVRVFRSGPMRTAVRATRPLRARRYRNVFEFTVVTA